jgi:hypothetical protein
VPYLHTDNLPIGGRSYKILARDLNILIPTGWLYNYLHMRKSSPLTRLQREMLATVVNGLVGGAP